MIQTPYISLVFRRTRIIIISCIYLLALYDMHCLLDSDVSGENFADFSMKFGEPSNEPFGAPDAGDTLSAAAATGGTTGAAEGFIPSVSASIPPAAAAASVTHQFSIRSVCTLMYTYVRVCTLMYTNVRVCTRMYVYVHLCTRMFTYVQLE